MTQKAGSPMPMDRRRFLSATSALGASTAFGLSSAALAQPVASPTPGPLVPAPPVPPDDGFAIHAPNLFPESFAYSWSTHKFYVGSLSRGRITSVDDDGKFATFSDDPSLVSTFGIFLDAARNILYACNADYGVGRRTAAATHAKLCELVAFDLETGRRITSIDLASAAPNTPHLPNDGTVAPDGTVYVTDTLSPIVYRVSPDGAPSVLVSDPRLGAAAGVPGLDGIQIARSGVLIANIISSGLLFRIDPVAKTVSAITFGLGAPPLVGCDGMRFDRDGRLWLARSILGGTNGRNMVHVLQSDDDWQTATVERSYPMNASTYQVAFTPKGPYAIQSRLEDLFSKKSAANVDGFSIVAVTPA